MVHRKFEGAIKLQGMRSTVRYGVWNVGVRSSSDTEAIEVDKVVLMSLI